MLQYCMLNATCRAIISNIVNSKKASKTKKADMIGHLTLIETFQLETHRKATIP